MLDRTLYSLSNILQRFVFTPIANWTLVVMIMAMVIQYITSICKSKRAKVRVYTRRSALSRHLLISLTSFYGFYKSPGWGSNPLINTFMSYVLLQKSNSQFRREYCLLNDRGVIAMDWYCSDNRIRSKGGIFVHCNDVKTTRSSTIRKSRCILLIIPDGSFSGLCVDRLCNDANYLGLSVVVFNRRGHRDSIMTNHKLQTYSDTSDLRQVIDYLNLRYHKQKLVAVGIGSGADLLLSYLGEYGSSSLLNVCAAISPTYDPRSSFCKGSKDIVDFRKPLQLIKLLKEKWLLYKNSASLGEDIDVLSALSSSSFHDFYKYSYYKFCEDSDGERYWEANDPLREVDEISCPLLCINSLDDPFCDPSKIPYDIFSVYPNMCLATSEVGGHCGFLESPGYSGRWKSWAVSLSLDYIIGVLDFVSKRHNN